MSAKKKFKGSFSDSWDMHKNDIVWKRFWVLFEFRRKWKWADWFYKQLDRTDDEIVAQEHWSLFPGVGYVKLCLWCALLRSVHEGLIEGVDELRIPKDVRKNNILEAIGELPDDIKIFPEIKGKFKDFRNVIFHCQWHPYSAKIRLDQTTVNKIEQLHINIGNWLDIQFLEAFKDFEKSYYTPSYWIYTDEYEEWMPETFY